MEHAFGVAAQLLAGGNDELSEDDGLGAASASLASNPRRLSRAECCKAARLAKRGSSTRVSDQVRRKIDRHNERAVTIGDQIELGKKRRFKSNERRRWAAGTVQRMAFGSIVSHDMADRYKFIRRRQRRACRNSLAPSENKCAKLRAQRSNMLGRVQTHLAHDMACSRATIAAAKCVNASIVDKAVRKQIDELPRNAAAILQISLDETEITLSRTQIGGSKRKRVLALTVPLFLMHGKLTPSRPGMFQPVNLICAPAILKVKTASCMLNAVKKRLPFDIAKFVAKQGPLVIVLMTDAAKSCDKLGRMLQFFGSANVPVYL